MDFNEWVAGEFSIDDDDTSFEFRLAKRAWEAGVADAGLELAKTMLKVFDIMDDPKQFRSALEASIAKMEAL